jgi:non-ribosomal peptide synthase protein (TIGR01720 family)
VGWFTSFFPLHLEAPEGSWEVRGPLPALRAVAARLRAVPRRGIGYGLLRYLGAEPEVRQHLAAAPRPEVSFNYLGQLDPVLGGDAWLAPAPEWSGPARHPATPRSHLLDVDLSVVGGRLQVAWTYGRALHRQATVAALAQRFLAVLESLVASALRLAGNDDAGSLAVGASPTAAPRQQPVAGRAWPPPADRPPLG